MTIAGLKATHGPLTIKLGPFSKTITPGPNERVGWGAIGFKFKVDGKTVLNLGDTLLHLNEWQQINKPDILMIPIGGKVAHNTMDEEDALEVVRMMNPELVIPCHYNVPAFFNKKYCPADDIMFKHEVDKIGAKCVILHKDESIEI
jgi:L-ascorbate metabolism protein UlaG (beta-lactamase superfamily)